EVRKRGRVQDRDLGSQRAQPLADSGRDGRLAAPWPAADPQGPSFAAGRGMFGGRAAEGLRERCDPRARALHALLRGVDRELGLDRRLVRHVDPRHRCAWTVRPSVDGTRMVARRTCTFSLARDVEGAEQLDFGEITEAGTREITPGPAV